MGHTAAHSPQSGHPSAVTGTCVMTGDPVLFPEETGPLVSDCKPAGILYGRFPFIRNGANAPDVSSFLRHCPPKILASARSRESGRPSAIGSAGVL